MLSSALPMNRVGCGSQTRRSGPRLCEAQRFMVPMRDCEVVEATHEPAPLAPALSRNGGEGGRRPREGESRFMAPTHVRILEAFPIRETQGRAGLSLPGHGAP